MLRRSISEVTVGDRFEFWARSKARKGTKGVPFRFVCGERTAYQIVLPAPYFEFFGYTHYADGNVAIEWDDEAIELSLAYRFNRATLARTGVTYLEFAEEGIKSYPSPTWPQWYAADGARPQLRFSPFKGWMNDPNGLCLIGDQYHLFYQFQPNGTEWGPMHWGHAVSPDLYHWTHYPVFLKPEQNLGALGATGGAFSGNAFVDPSGQLSFYYTERLPAYDLYQDYKEVQKRLVPAADLVGPVASQVVLEIGPPGSAHDFRDPKVWFDRETSCYRMIVGAAMNGNPAVLIFGSPDGLSWSYIDVLYEAPSHFREHGARCVECPDFFEIDATWVLVMGFVGFTDPETGRHNLLYAATGTFANDQFSPVTPTLQELDFGTDYYAMQSFAARDKQLAFAWLFNWEFRKPAGSAYSGEMSLPRVLGLDERSRLTMLPEDGYKTLRQERLDMPGRYLLPSVGDATELRLTGTLAGVKIVGRSGAGAEFVIWEADGRLNVKVPEDDGKIVYRSAPLKLRDILMFFDHGVIEIFSDGGAVCGTRRSYRVTDLVSIEVILGSLTRVEVIEAWSCNSAWR